eukprot:2698483-Amphidinium_carterae.5
MHTYECDDVVDISHLPIGENALIASQSGGEGFRSWVVDSGSGEHLVGRTMLHDKEHATIEPLTSPVRLRTANGIVTCRHHVPITIRSRGKTCWALVLEDAPLVLSMGKLAEDSVFFRWTTTTSCVLDFVKSEICLRLSHRVPMLDDPHVIDGVQVKTMGNDMDCDDHVPCALARTLKSVCFQDGSKPIHDEIAPQYNVVEFCCGKESMISNAVIHGSRTNALRITEDIDGTRPDLIEVVKEHVATYGRHIHLASMLWHKFVELASWVMQQHGVIVFEWPVNNAYWHSDQVREFFKDGVGARWYTCVVHGCSAGLCDDHGRKMAKRWEIRTNSSHIWPALMSFSQCHCTEKHVRVEGNNTRKSGEYPSLLAMKFHKALTVWSSDMSWLGNLGLKHATVSCHDHTGQDAPLVVLLIGVASAWHVRTICHVFDAVGMEGTTNCNKC